MKIIKTHPFDDELVPISFWESFWSCNNIYYLTILQNKNNKTTQISEAAKPRAKQTVEMRRATTCAVVGTETWEELNVSGHSLHFQS